MTTRCPLCGQELEPTQASCPPSCPMGPGCTLIRCPRCGYEMPGETRLTKFLRRLFKVPVDRHPSEGSS